MSESLRLATDPPLTVGEIVSRYLRHSETENVHCPEALAERQRTLGLFAAAHGHVPWPELRPFHLEDWIAAHAGWKSVSTRRAKCNEVRACFQWAARGGRIDRNPFASVSYREAERRPELPDAVLDRIASLANKPFEHAVRFLRLTGCRLSELCEAEWSDMDLERGIWIIARHKSRRYTGRAKVVALVQEAVELLRRLRGETPPMAPAAASGGVAGVLDAPDALPVFLNSRGRPWTRRTLGQQLRRLKARHGIEERATLHGIRHRLASAAIAAGAPVKLVSAQLGHATQAVTERYYCHLGEAQIDAVREAARLGLPKK